MPDPAPVQQETPGVVEICHKAIAAFGSPQGMEETDDFATLARAYLALLEQLRALTPERVALLRDKVLDAHYCDDDRCEELRALVATLERLTGEQK